MFETKITEKLNVPLRDLFAALGFFVLIHERPYVADPRSLAIKCYAMADAMMNEREAQR